MNAKESPETVGSMVPQATWLLGDNMEGQGAGSQGSSYCNHHPTVDYSTVI